MTMHLVRGMTTTNFKKRKTKNKSKKQLEADAKHEKWLRKMNAHPDQIKENKKNNESFFSLAESLAVSMGAVDDEVLKKKAEANALAVLEARTAHPCGSNFTCMVERFARDHLPISDVDGDGFSTVHHRGLRGSHWRGADCDDTSATVYPGRKISSSRPDRRAEA